MRLKLADFRMTLLMMCLTFDAVRRHSRLFHDSILSPLSKPEPGNLSLHDSSMHGTPSQSSKDAFVKITFKVNHPPSRPKVDDVGVCMHVIGSIKALGSWDHNRGKRMTRSADGTWELNVYVPAVEFLYQYVLKDIESGDVVWESTLERKQNVKEDINMTVHVHDNITTQEDTPNKAKNINGQAQALIPELAAAEPTATGDLIKWTDEDDEYESRDSLLPAPTFACTNSLNKVSIGKACCASTSSRLLAAASEREKNARCTECLRSCDRSHARFFAAEKTKLLTLACLQSKRNARASMSGFYDCNEACKVNGQSMSAVMSPAKITTPIKTPHKGNESTSIIDWLSQALAPNTPSQASQPVLVDGTFLLSHVRRYACPVDCACSSHVFSARQCFVCPKKS
jgi:hypothetical protein